MPKRLLPTRSTGSSPLHWLFTSRVDVGYDDHCQQADCLYGHINGDGLHEQLFPTLLTMQRSGK